MSDDKTCPVCGYDRLEFPPRDYSICSRCGTEFGYDDRVLTHAQLRDEWIAKGRPWFYEPDADAVLICDTCAQNCGNVDDFYELPTTCRCGGTISARAKPETAPVAAKGKL